MEHGSIHELVTLTPSEMESIKQFAKSKLIQDILDNAKRRSPNRFQYCKICDRPASFYVVYGDGSEGGICQGHNRTPW